MPTDQTRFIATFSNGGADFNLRADDLIDAARKATESAKKATRKLGESVTVTSIRVSR